MIIWVSSGLKNPVNHVSAKKCRAVVNQVLRVTQFPSNIICTELMYCSLNFQCTVR